MGYNRIEDTTHQSVPDRRGIIFNNNHLKQDSRSPSQRFVKMK